MDSRGQLGQIRVVIIFISLLHVICELLFLRGFLMSSGSDRKLEKPLSVSGSTQKFPPDNSNLPTQKTAEGSYKLSNSSQVYSSQGHLNKLVLFLIDALRADFIFGNETSIRFIKEKLISGQAKGFVAKARTPTVTLPRLKAILSGIHPSFSDIIFNFGTSEFLEDNLIKRLQESGNRMIFYGDDTWLRLFPNHFQRSEGVTSFFASDYTEVDLNVTRNVLAEIDRDDWDVMVLHYLGLDHIGHSAGPRSHLVPLKLDEMSKVMEKIYYKLKKTSGNNLMIIFGDHGMTDAGSHGGNSASETDTGMVFLSPSFPKSDKPDKRFIVGQVSQIDLASTLAILKQVPVPERNIGIPIFPILREFLSPEEIRTTICLMTGEVAMHDMNDQEQLLLQSANLGEAELQHWACRKKRESVFANATQFKQAEDFFEAVSKILSSRSSAYGLESMLAGLIGMFLCLTTLIFFHQKMINVWYWSDAVSVTLIIFHASSFAASSFIEEEHQLWYAWAPLMYFILLLRSLKSDRGVTLHILALLIIHRIAKEWNRTGNKWLHIPDIGDWLLEPTHEVFLHSLIIICGFLQPRMTEKPLKYLTAFLAVSLFHIFRWNVFAWVAYGFIAISIVLDRVTEHHFRPEVLKDCIVVLTSLICRSHNVPVVAAVQLNELILRFACRKLNLSPQKVMMAYLCLSWNAFFLLGNSNAISSIDVSAGFIGIPIYCAPLHGFLIFLHTYSGPLFGFLTAVIYFKTYNMKSRFQLISFNVIVRSVLLFSTLFNATLQRHHTFVWSVFAPKVLYETSHSMLFCILAILSLK